ncbi:MAG: hypothetical protein VR72_15355 [Clostridiaceae bacterium BRH_c20a]|nr:MAG: hypothetical protein VR72_15355 [Clostridiaceae bacterium BRH_c20a]
MRFIGSGIKGKLWLGMMILVITILLTAWFFQIFFLKSFYISERENTLINEGIKIASVLAETNTLEIASAIRSEHFSFSDSIHGSIILIDNKKDLIDYVFLNNFESRQSPRIEISMRTRFMNWLNKDTEINTKINEEKVFAVTSGNFPRPSIIVGIPIKNSNTVLGTLILESPLAPIEESIFILRKQLTIISLFSLLLGTIISILLSRHLTKPILNISSAAEKIAKGDFDTSVNIYSNDEIGTLGRIINNLPKELQKLDNFRKDFIANTTHELKTPISLIQAYAELIRDLEGEDKKSRDQHLQVIIDESRRLNHIVEDILYLSQIEPDSIKLNSKDFLLVDLLRSTLEKLQFLATRRNIELILDVENEAIKAFGDQEKLYQVFFNIINNAISYSPKNKRVIIKVYQNARVEVVDYGIGIPQKDLPYIWDRFYKVDKSRKRYNNSTGLGLAIVKNILEAHGFKYGVESKENEGTLFWIEMC